MLRLMKMNYGEGIKFLNFQKICMIFVFQTMKIFTCTLISFVCFWQGLRSQVWLWYGFFEKIFLYLLGDRLRMTLSLIVGRSGSKLHMGEIVLSKRQIRVSSIRSEKSSINSSSVSLATTEKIM